MLQQNVKVSDLKPLIDHSESKILTSFSKSGNEVQSAVIEPMIPSKMFCRLDLQPKQSLCWKVENKAFSQA